MPCLYLVGGQQQYLLPVFAEERRYYEYHKAVMVAVDISTHSSALALEYVSPEDARAELGSMLFKAAGVGNDRLYICTTTEILIFSLPSFQKVGYITHPLFNDVHHVTPGPNGNLFVANSGLEMVMEFTEDGELVNLWDVLGGDPWRHLAGGEDYRRANLKPHRAHPNYVFFIGEEPWVTRFYQKDAVSLINPTRRIEIGLGSPHDGIVNGSYVYFTTVNGNVVQVDQRTLKVKEVIDLNLIHRHGGPLAWSRGLYVEDGLIWVGYSRLRPTKLKENVDWVKHSLKWKLRRLLPERFTRSSLWMKHGLKKELPTRIACYDIRTSRCLQEIDVEPFGISAIFSIIPDHALLRSQEAPVHLLSSQQAYGTFVTDN